MGLPVPFDHRGPFIIGWEFGDCTGVWYDPVCWVPGSSWVLRVGEFPLAVAPSPGECWGVLIPFTPGECRGVPGLVMAITAIQDGGGLVWVGDNHQFIRVLRVLILGGAEELLHIICWGRLLTQ